MAQVIPANELTLSQVEDQFNLRQVLDDPDSFLHSELPQYAFSTEFSLFRPENELYHVLKVLKRFAEVVAK
jgi:hypothetical protein